MPPQTRLYGIFLLFSGLLLSFLNGFGQACCSGGTPITNNLQPVLSDAGEIVLLLNLDHNFQDDLVHKQSLLGDNNRERITNAFIIRPSYTISPRIGVSAIMSYVTKLERAENVTGSGHSTSRTQGFGDLVLMMQYALYKAPVFSMIVGGGMKLPTGAVDHTDDQTGLLLHPDIQPGSGAWEGLVVAQLAGKWLQASLDLDAVVSYRLTENASRFDGQQKYKFGNEMQVVAGVQRPVFLTRSIISPGASLKYRFTAHDKLNDQEAPNTGGHWVHILPVLRLSLDNGIGIEVYGEFPLFRDLDGIQLTTSYRFGANLIYRFTPTGSGQFIIGG